MREDDPDLSVRDAIKQVTAEFLTETVWVDEKTAAWKITPEMARGTKVNVPRENRFGREIFDYPRIINQVAGASGVGELDEDEMGRVLALRRILVNKVSPEATKQVARGSLASMLGVNTLPDQTRPFNLLGIENTPR